MNLYNPSTAGHNPPCNANTLRRFGSLNNVADMPLSYRGFFVSASLMQPFSMGGKRWEALRLLDTLPVFQPAFLPFANVFGSTGEHYLNVKKETP